MRVNGKRIDGETNPILTDGYKPTSHKYGAVPRDGFRSTLEYNVSKYLKELGIAHCYECFNFVLIPSFEDKDKKKYRELCYKVDFSIKLKSNRYVHVEMKGFATPEFKLKWKLLQYHLMENNLIQDDFIICKSLKELKERLHEYNNDVEILSDQAITELPLPIKKVSRNRRTDIEDRPGRSIDPIRKRSRRITNNKRLLGQVHDIPVQGAVSVDV